MIEKKYKHEIKHEAKCNFCNTEYFYTDEDVIDINSYQYGFICPECGNEIVTSKRVPCTFPNSFFKFGDSCILTNEETQKLINNVKKSLEEDEEDDYGYAMAGTGDTMVFGTKEDGIYYDIYVAKNYWHDSYLTED